MTSFSDVDIHVMGATTDAETVVREICLSGKQHDAFYVMDVGEIVRTYRKWQTHLPRVQPFYAVKCNSSKLFLEVMAALGAGFDCASQGEIDAVLALGVQPDRIIYANPAKVPASIVRAASTGVQLATFDNEAELYKMKLMHPHSKLVLRLNPGDNAGPLDMGVKFGCEPVHEAPRLMQLARDLGLRVYGVSFQASSGDAGVFHKAIKMARSLFDQGQKMGHDMRMLDVGGGYPGGRDKPIDEIARVINLALDELFPGNDVQIIAEPGKYFASTAYILGTCIHSKREIHSADRRDLLHVMYYINDGTYSNFRIWCTHGFHCLPTVLSAPAGKLIPSSVWGQTCDGVDKVDGHLMLPSLDVGEWLIYPDQGAYTLSTAVSNFNGFPPPNVLTVVDVGTRKLLEAIWPESRSRFVTETLSKDLKTGLHSVIPI